MKSALSLALMVSCASSLDGGLSPESSDLADSHPFPVIPECTRVTNPSLPLADEGAFIPQDSRVSAHREACTTALHALAGARDSVLKLDLAEWDGVSPARLSIWSLTDQQLVGPTELSAGGSLEISLPQTGEVFLHLEPSDPNEPANSYALELSCLEGCGDEYTRYPILLMHGLGGTDAYWETDYFYRVQDVMGPMGYALHAPSVTSFSNTELRGLEWEDHLLDLVDSGAGRRFNIIAHSQGGIDARYLVSGLGQADRIASVVSVGTPHHGTPLADLLTGLMDDGVVDPYWIDVGADAMTELFGLGGSNTSLAAALGSLTTEALSDFNVQYPNHPDVYYASWAGFSCGALDFSCQKDCAGEVVDPLLATSHFILWLLGERNDGMSPTDSAIWGDYRGELWADHIDQVGLWADTGSDAFNHIDFYLEELRRLAERGL
jgi:triacylglycerol lipase